MYESVGIAKNTKLFLLEKNAGEKKNKAKKKNQPIQIISNLKVLKDFSLLI